MSVTLIVLSELGTFLLSMGTTIFIAGTKWGMVQSRLEGMSDRLAKIEGMFTLRLKGPDDK